jgi:hypothetical protein
VEKRQAFQLFPSLPLSGGGKGRGKELRYQYGYFTVNQRTQNNVGNHAEIAYNYRNSTNDFEVIKIGKSIRIKKASFDKWLGN